MSNSSSNSDSFDCNLAVVIGINQYQERGISDLNTARFDAKRLKKILEKKYNYEVKLFTDEPITSRCNWKNATFANITNYLKTELPLKIKSFQNKRVRLLFYFAGHGTPPEGEDGDAGFLLPQDAEISQRKEWLSMKDIHDKLIDLECHHLLIILDCCYAGAFRFGTRHLGAAMPEVLSKQLYERYSEHPAGQVIASTTHNQEAFDIINDNRGKIENSQHSPFAEFLFRALEEGAADYNKDGITTVRELDLYLSENLYERTKDRKRPQVSRTWFLPKLDEGEFFFQTGAEFDPEKLPDAIALNKDNNPYRGLESFEEAHSRFFFGRSEKINELQKRIDSDDRPLTTVLGISGSGKSSLVKAGLIPQLREDRTQWRILKPISPGATVFKDLARAVLPLKLEDSDPDLKSLKLLDELLKNARRKNPRDEKLQDLYAQWRRTDPEEKLLLIIKYYELLKELSSDDETQQQLLAALRKQGLKNSRLVLDNLDRLKQCKCNWAEQNQLEEDYQRYKQKIDDWSKAWQQDGKQFGDFVAENCPKNIQTKILLVIDQFEQIITQCDRKEREQFLNALYSALKTCPQQLRLVLTLRSDYQHNFENSEQLKEYWEKSLFRLGQMKRDQLREAIEQPALAQVLYFETNDEGKSLVDQLLDDLGETPGGLPLLSFTLSELYYAYIKKQQSDRTLKWQDYENLGGVTKSLTSRATQEYNNLALDFVQDEALSYEPAEAKARKTMLRWIMLRMVNLNGGEKAKRRVLDDELKYDDEKTNQYRELVINCFVDARLLVKGTNLEGKSYVEPIHDVLIRDWQKITDWLSETQEESRRKYLKLLGMKLPIVSWRKKHKQEQKKFDFNLQREITIAALRYKEVIKQQSKNTADWLWHDDPRLPLVEQVYRSSDNWLNEKEIEFFEKSDSKKKARIFRRWSIFISAFAILAGFTSAIFIQLQIANTREKVARVQNLLSVNPTEGLVLAIEAVGDTQRPLLKPFFKSTFPSVQSSLLSAIQLSKERNILKGHQMAVTSVAISQDRNIIVSGSVDRTVRLWNKQGYLISPPLEGHNAPVNSVDISKDGQIIVSADRGTTGKIIIWDREGKKIISPFNHGSAVNSIVISESGEFILSGGWDKKLKIWDTKGQLITPPIEHESAVTSIAVSKDNNTIVSGTYDGKVYLWNLNGKPISSPFDKHENPVYSVTISDDGEIIGSSGDPGTILLWNREGKLITSPIQENIPSTRSVTIDDTKKILASSGYDSLIRIRNLQGKIVNPLLRGHQEFVNSVDINNKEEIIVSGSNDTTIRLWDNQFDFISPPFTAHNEGNNNSIGANSIDISGDGQLIVSGGRDNKVKLWDRNGNLIISTLEDHDEWVMSVALSDNRKVIVTGSRDNTVRLWNQEGKSLAKPLIFNEDITSVAIDSIGETIASGSLDGVVRLFNRKGEFIAPPLKGHDSEYGNVIVKVSENGDVIASASFDNIVKIWNRKGESIIPPFTAHRDIITALDISNDGQVIVTGSRDRRVILWDNQGNIIGEPLEHQAGITSVSISSDSSYIITTSSDGLMHRWDNKGNKIGQSIQGSIFSSVVISKDRETVITASYDGTIQFWRGGDWLNWLNMACNRLINHPIFLESEEASKLAIKTCQDYGWKDRENSEFLINQGFYLAINSKFNLAANKIEEAHKFNPDIMAQDLIKKAKITSGFYKTE